MNTLVDAARYTINDTKLLEEDDKQMVYSLRKALIEAFASMVHGLHSMS